MNKKSLNHEELEKVSGGADIGPRYIHKFKCSGCDDIMSEINFIARSIHVGPVHINCPNNGKYEEFYTGEYTGEE